MTFCEDWDAVKNELNDLDQREAIMLVASGVTDPKKIRQCIESGIDAELAFKLYLEGIL